MHLPVILSPRQKAAVIVRVLLEDEGDLSLEALSGDAQAALAHELAGMDIIDRATRDAVVDEFCDTLEQVGLTFPEGIGNALDLLEGRISQDCSDSLRRLAALSGDADPWERLLSLPAARIVEIAKVESLQIVSVLFARLSPAVAAEAFSSLDVTRARRIAYAMSMTDGIEEASLHRIGIALMQAVEALPRPALTGPSTDRVGAILTRSGPDTRAEILDGLDRDDKAFAQGVRKALFTWAHIPEKIAASDIPRIIRQVDQASLVKALAGSEGLDAETTTFIYSAISVRMADALKEEVANISHISPDEAYKAMGDIVITIRDMEAAGDLNLIVSNNS